jgi:hypothetical protein
MQVAEPPHIALAPRGDAVAQPILLSDDLAVELVLFAFFFRQNFVSPSLEIRKAAFDVACPSAVQPHRAARQF